MSCLCKMSGSIAKKMSCPRAKVHISSVLGGSLRIPLRGESLRQLPSVKSYDLTKLTTLGEEMVRLVLGRSVNGHFCQHVEQKCKKKIGLERRVPAFHGGGGSELEKLVELTL